MRTFKEIFENLISDLNVDYVFHETTSWKGRKSVLIQKLRLSEEEVTIIVFLRTNGVNLVKIRRRGYFKVSITKISFFPTAVLPAPTRYFTFIEYNVNFCSEIIHSFFISFFASDYDC